MITWILLFVAGVLAIIGALGLLIFIYISFTEKTEESLIVSGLLVAITIAAMLYWELDLSKKYSIKIERISAIAESTK